MRAWIAERKRCAKCARRPSAGGNTLSIAARTRCARTGEAPWVEIATTISPRSTIAGMVKSLSSGRSTMLTSLPTLRARSDKRSIGRVVAISADHQFDMPQIFGRDQAPHSRRRPIHGWPRATPRWVLRRRRAPARRRRPAGAASPRPRRRCRRQARAAPEASGTTESCASIPHPEPWKSRATGLFRVGRSEIYPRQSNSTVYFGECICAFGTAALVFLKLEKYFYNQ